MKLRKMDNRKITVHVESDVRQLIPGYLENKRNHVRSLKCALAIGDLTKVRYLADNLNGSGSIFGFDVISYIGQGLESAAEGKNAERICMLIRSLEDYLNRLHIVYV